MAIRDQRIKPLDPQVTYGTASRGVAESSHLEFSDHFFYNGHTDVYILTRDGMIYKLQGSKIVQGNSDNTGLFCFSRRAIDSTVEIGLDSDMLNVDTFGREVYANLRRSGVIDRNMTTARFEQFVSLGKIHNAGGSVYVHSLDIVISLANPITYGIRHPYSPSATMELPTEEENNKAKGTASIKVVIVDNTRATGNKWFKVGDNAFCVKPQSIPSTNNGVYIIRQGGDDARAVDEYYTLETLEANKLSIRFYNSKAAALADQETAEIQLQVAKQKLETEQYKTEQNQRKLEDDELAAMRARVEESLNKTLGETESRIKFEREELERRMRSEWEDYERRRKSYYDEEDRKRKDRYDDRSSQRKDFSEMLKMIPTVLSIALAVLVLVKGGKK